MGDGDDIGVVAGGVTATVVGGCVTAFVVAVGGGVAFGVLEGEATGTCASAMISRRPRQANVRTHKGEAILLIWECLEECLYKYVYVAEGVW